MRKAFSILSITILLLAGVATTVLAHHGWAWTTGGNIDLSGAIKSVKLGNPHGIVKVDVNGEEWTVEVGQPWRNERAGLKPEDFAIGITLRSVGEPSANIEDKRLKAERLYIDGKEYDLYPNRN